MKIQKNQTSLAPKRSAVIRVCTFLLVVVMATSFAYAGIPMTGYDEDGNEAWDLSEWWETNGKVYDIFARITSALGTVSFVIGGIKAMASDESASKKGLAQMKYSLIAVAAIQLLPVVIMLGFELAEPFMWDAANPVGYGG